MHLQGYLSVDASEDAVSFGFSVENTGAEPVDIHFSSGKTADVTVFREGTEIWRWSDGRMFTQLLRTETIAPGESITHDCRWDYPSPGYYSAEATLEATNVDLVERVEFEV